MTNLSSHIDRDQPTLPTGPTPSTAGATPYEVRCNVCGAAFFVSESAYLFAKEGIEAGLGNPFKCDDCEEAYDQLSY